MFIVFVALLLMLIFASGIPASQQPPAQEPATKRSGTQAPPKSPAIKPEAPATAQAPAVTDAAAPKAAAGKLNWMEIQVRLDRLSLSPGEIDGSTGRNSREAVKAFQESQGLQPTGRPDTATLEALAKASPEPVITTYTLSEADVKGPFTPDIPKDLVDQGALETLAYRDVREMIAERFHASAALMAKLNPGVKWTVGSEFKVPAVAPLELPAGGPRDAAAPPQVAAEVVVTDATKSLTARAADGTILLHAPVTVGSDNDPLPVGEWKVLSVSFQPKFHYNPDLFWDANPSHAKTVIPSGPNNPVGLVWIDLSKEHYGLHGTPEPGRVGHTASHGCVRLTNWDAVRLASIVNKSTKVVFQK